MQRPAPRLRAGRRPARQTEQPTSSAASWTSSGFERLDQRVYTASVAASCRAPITRPSRRSNPRPRRRGPRLEQSSSALPPARVGSASELRSAEALAELRELARVDLVG